MEAETSLTKRVWALIKPYWTSEERWRAGGLLAIIIALNLGEVYIVVLLNKWNNDFYNALQAVDKKAFYAALGTFCYLAFSFIIVAVYKIYLNQMLRIKWRRWMTAHYLSDWLKQQNYYRMQLLGNPADNPDQRISEDIEQFLLLTITLSLGLMSAVVTLISFLTILWGLSGSLDVPIGGTVITIPGYMVWVALIYAIAGTGLTMLIGRPLVKLNFNQQRFEADFRFSLVRLRENTESIAFYKGEEQEKLHFGHRFSNVVDNFWQIMKRQKTLTWFTSFYGQIAIIFPFIVAAPRFFAGKIQLGGLMQTASAFGQVQGALSYIIDSYTSIATWKAVVDRLSGFNLSLQMAEKSTPAAQGFIPIRSDAPIVKAKHLTIRLPDGKLLLDELSLAVSEGDSLLITGPSGSGKSTLLRALAGLWPFAQGTLTLPQEGRMLFVPQKPYLPLGTLREVLCYPSKEVADDATILPVLKKCKLEHLATLLDETESWSHIFSLGEQQRIAFARILLNKPDFLFLDEATSALDEESEAYLYGLLKEAMPNLSLISVGHRSSIKHWHNNEKSLIKAA